VVVISGSFVDISFHSSASEEIAAPVLASARTIKAAPSTAASTPNVIVDFMIVSSCAWDTARPERMHGKRDRIEPMGTTEDPRPAIRALVEEQLETARAAWPALSLDSRAFVEYAAERFPSGVEGGEAILARHLPDLYLACGCAQGNAAAVAQLEERFLSQVRSFVSGIDTNPDFVDEVRQALREHLLIGRDGRQPCIADYTGRGALSRWLRVSAQRIALNLRRSKKPQAELADDDRVTSKNPELDYLKKHAQGAFAEALRAALASLTVHERNLLRLHFVDGLSTPEIAPLFQSHRTTIRRQLNDCQETLLKRVRESLRTRLQLTESQVESLLRDGRKSLELSLSTVL
jgi:RNA polymerase sigma-70 factor (ECF subfamily)